MLWLALHLPQLPLESALTGEDETQPQVIYETRGMQQTVFSLNQAAELAGIQRGMTLSSALPLCETLDASERDPRNETSALNNLALWAQQFTPVISLQTPNGLLLEIESSLNLFSGLEPLQHQLAESISALGYSAHQSVAPTPSGAWLLALARWSHSITDKQQLSQVLKQLPLTLLPIDAKKIDALRGMGLKTIGDCLQLPRAGLSRRLGTELLMQLDRAFGLLADPRDTFQIPDHFHSQVMLPDTVLQLQPLLFILQRLLRELCGFLLARGAGAQRLQIGFITPYQPVEYLQLQLLNPSRDPDHLFKLWQEKLDNHTLTAPVEGLELEVKQLLPLKAEALDLLNPQRNQSQSFNQFLERLKNRLGDDAIRQPLCHPSHRPEQASQQGHYPVSKPGLVRPRAKRPLWLLPTPKPLQQSGNTPYLKGPLTLLQGPERIESGWWEDVDLRRDYYIARTRQQQTVWIYQELQPPAQWFLHGLFS